MPDYAVAASELDGVAVVRVEGEIDLANASTLAERFLAHVGDSAPGAVLDLGGVAYLDSAGVRAFFSLARRLALREQVFAVALPEHSPLWRLLKTTRAGEVAVLCHTATEAVELVRSTSASDST
jgi:anti-anti-sigma factor